MNHYCLPSNFRIFFDLFTEVASFRKKKWDTEREKWLVFY